MTKGDRERDLIEKKAKLRRERSRGFFWFVGSAEVLGRYQGRNGLEKDFSNRFFTNCIFMGLKNLG